MTRLLRPTIFGAFDGLTVVLGVLLSLAGKPELIIPAAVGVAVAEGVGMAAGEWLSDSEHGFLASSVIGLATVAGSILPALPWAVARGHVAEATSIVVLALLGLGIAVLRARSRGWVRALVETYGVLVVVLVAVSVCELLTPGGGGS